MPGAYFNKEYLDKGLGDGFPLIAPTLELVGEFLEEVKLDPLEVVGNLAPGYGCGYRGEDRHQCRHGGLPA